MSIRHLGDEFTVDDLDTTHGDRWIDRRGIEASLVGRWPSTRGALARIAHPDRGDLEHSEIGESDERPTALADHLTAFDLDHGSDVCATAGV